MPDAGYYLFQGLNNLGDSIAEHRKVRDEAQGLDAAFGLLADAALRSGVPLPQEGVNFYSLSSGGKKSFLGEAYKTVALTQQQKQAEEMGRVRDAQIASERATTARTLFQTQNEQEQAAAGNNWNLRPDDVRTVKGVTFAPNSPKTQTVIPGAPTKSFAPMPPRKTWEPGWVALPMPDGSYDWKEDVANFTQTTEGNADYPGEIRTVRTFKGKPAGPEAKPGTNSSPQTFKKGDLVKQNGVTYEFDGKNWYTVKTAK